MIDVVAAVHSSSIIQLLHKMNHEFNLGFPNDKQTEEELGTRLFAAIYYGDIFGWVTYNDALEVTGVLLCTCCQNFWSGKDEVHELVLVTDKSSPRDAVRLVKEFARFSDQCGITAVAGSITGVGWPLYKRYGFQPLGSTFKKQGGA